MFDASKTRMNVLPYGEKNCDKMLSRFYLIPEHYGRTHRQTDRQTEGRTDRITISTPCPEKNGTNNILGITLTNTNV